MYVYRKLIAYAFLMGLCEVSLPKLLGSGIFRFQPTSRTPSPSVIISTSTPVRFVGVLSPSRRAYTSDGNFLTCFRRIAIQYPARKGSFLCKCSLLKADLWLFTIIYFNSHDIFHKLYIYCQHYWSPTRLAKTFYRLDKDLSHYRYPFPQSRSGSFWNSYLY